MHRRSSTEPGVAGERGPALVVQPAPAQARLANLVALGLVLLLGGASLLWYHAHRPASGRLSRAQPPAGASAAAELPPPPLGPIDVPSILPPTSPLPAAATATLNNDSMPLLTASPANAGPGPMPVTAAPVSSIDRRLGGAVFADGAATQSVPLSPLTASGSPPPGTDTPIPVGPQPIAAPPDVAAGLPGLMRPDRRNAVEASVLPTRRLLLPKGAFIDCTLETAIDSTLPGLTTCIVATDTFGADGSVVLLERGTKLLGETRGQVQQGASRVFVIWTEARTPDGVVVPLDSPATDELGRSGLPGSVQRHFWQRFGAAIMISTLDGALQAAVQSSARGGALIYNPAPSADIMNDVLKGSIAIAPTVIKRNGDRIQVLVARDVDFRGVYELRHANAAH